MSKNSSESGFAPVLILVAVAGVVALMAISGVQLRNQFNSSKSDVRGVLIARGGDDSGGTSGGSGGTSGGSSGGSSETSNTSRSGSSQDQPSGNPSGEHRQGGFEHPTFGFGNNKIATGDAKPLPLPAFLNRERHEHEFEASEAAEMENELETEKVEHLTIKPGRHLEIETKDASGESQLLTSTGSGVLRIKLPSQHGPSIEIQQTADGLLVISGGQSIQTNFPLSFDKTTGQLSVQLGNGTTRVIRILPNQASEIARNAGIESQLGQIQLASSSGTLIYKMQGEKTVRILGIIPVTIPVSGTVDAENGTPNTDLPWWAKLFQ